MLRGSAEEVNQDAGFGLAEARAWRHSLGGVQPEPIRETEAKHPQSADMEQITAGDAVAGTARGAKHGPHDGSPKVLCRFGKSSFTNIFQQNRRNCKRIPEVTASGIRQEVAPLS